MTRKPLWVLLGTPFLLAGLGLLARRCHDAQVAPESPAAVTPVPDPLEWARATAWPIAPRGFTPTAQGTIAHADDDATVRLAAQRGFVATGEPIRLRLVGVSEAVLVDGGKQVPFVQGDGGLVATATAPL